MGQSPTSQVAGTGPSAGGNHRCVRAPIRTTSSCPSAPSRSSLADVEGCTRLWETERNAMTTAVARYDDLVADAVSTHGGVRPPSRIWTTGKTLR
jgi:hypothetical protein